MAIGGGVSGGRAGKGEALRARASGAGQDVAVVVCDGLSMMELGVACDVFGGPYGAAFGVPWYRLSDRKSVV